MCFFLLGPSDQPFYSPASFNVIYIYCWYPLCIHLLGQASSEKPCGRQEQPIVNKVCIQFEYITKVRYFTNRLKFQSTYHYLYTNKRKNLHLWHPLISIEEENINRDHCWHHIPWQSQNGLKRSCVCHPFTIRSVCDCLRPFHVWWR